MGTLEKYERVAPLYDLVDLADGLYKRPLRRRLFAGLDGRILDAGAGTGRNVPFYPAGARIVAIDLSAGMLRRAVARAARFGRPGDFVAMDVRRTGFADATFDAVVSAFMFCVLDEAMQTPALVELARVCKPGGEVRILDYVMSDRPLVRLGMRVWQVWEKLVYDGAFDRHTERYLTAAGLEPVREERFVAGMVRLISARKPG